MSLEPLNQDGGFGVMEALLLGRFAHPANPTRGHTTGNIERDNV